MSEFEKWFVEQHGERPQGPDVEELRTRIAVGNRAKQLLETRELWDARHESALYAWQAQSPAGKKND